MRRIRLLGLAACACAFFPGCTLEQVSRLSEETEARPALPAPKGYRAELARTLWALERVSRDRTVIWVRSAETRSCDFLHHAVVREVEGGFRVKVLNRGLIPTSPRYGCLLPLYVARSRVDLPRPLREGEEIFGECRPGDATPKQRTCALMQPPANR